MIRLPNGDWYLDSFVARFAPELVNSFPRDLASPMKRDNQEHAEVECLKLRRYHRYERNSKNCKYCRAKLVNATL